MNVISGTVDENAYGNLSHGDLDKPLDFFRHLFVDGGFLEYRTKFYAEEPLSVIYSWDPFFRPISSPKSISDYLALAALGHEVHDEEKQELDFKEQLQARLQFHEKKSYEILRKKIDTLSGSDEIGAYLKKQIVDLSCIVTGIKEDSDINMYKENLEVVNRLDTYIKTTYSPFLTGIIPPINQYTSEPLEKVPYETIVQPLVNEPGIIKRSHDSHPSLTGFKWKYETKGNTLLLHMILKKNQVIPDDPTTFDNFVLAFSGETLSEPLRIKWNLVRSKLNNPNPSLVRVIKRTLMERLHVIEDVENGPLSKIIEFVFIGPKDKEIKNVVQTLNQKIADRIPTKEKILVDELVKAPFSATPS